MVWVSFVICCFGFWPFVRLRVCPKVSPFDQYNYLPDQKKKEKRNQRIHRQAPLDFAGNLCQQVGLLSVERLGEPF